MQWLRAHWIAVATAAGLFLVGIGIGAAGEDGTPAADPQPAAAEVVTDTETVTRTATETVTETVPATEEEVAALEERSARLDERATRLTEREEEVETRERKVARAERVQERSRFADGVYLVGTDVPAGSYVAAGGDGCYWARLENGSQEIIANHFGSGQARVTLYRGELFETSGCGRWRRG